MITARLTMASTVLVASLGLCRHCTADDAVGEKFAAEYRANMPALIERYVKNRKIRTVIREYRTSNPIPNEPIGTKTAEYRVLSVSDGDRMRIEIMTDKAQDRGEWILLRPLDRVDITRNKSLTDYTVSRHRATGTNPEPTESARVLTGQYLPLLAPTSTMPRWLQYIERPDANSHARWSITSVNTTTWRGHRVKAVKIFLTQKHGQFKSYYTLYLDLNNNLVFRGDEGEGTSQDGTPWKFHSELSYTQTSDGELLPSKYETYQILPNGSKVPRRIVEVKEYSRYTPSPDEFTLAQFGLAEPTLPATVQPRKRYVWHFVAVGVGFAVIAIVIYWRVRRSMRVPVVPTPG